MTSWSASHYDCVKNYLNFGLMDQKKKKGLKLLLYFCPGYFETDHFPEPAIWTGVNKSFYLHFSPMNLLLMGQSNTIIICFIIFL